MAKIWFIIGEHPTEVVAAHHARQVAKILKDKYGHKVTFFKVPTEQTAYKKLRGSRPMKAILHELTKPQPGTANITKIFASAARGPVVNFHCTPAHSMGEATSRTVAEFRLARKLGSHAELEIEHVGSNGFVVEVPALYQKVPEHTLDRIVAKGFVREANSLLDERELTREERRALVANLTPDRQLRVAALKTPGQAKYLDPRISRRLEKEIHEQLQPIAKGSKER